MLREKFRCLALLGPALILACSCSAGSEDLRFAAICQENGGPRAECECVDRKFQAAVSPEDYDLTIAREQFSQANPGDLWRDRDLQIRLAGELGMELREFTMRSTRLNRTIQPFWVACAEEHPQERQATAQEREESASGAASGARVVAALPDLLYGEWNYRATQGPPLRPSFAKWTLVFHESGQYGECALQSPTDEFAWCTRGSYRISGDRIKRVVDTTSLGRRGAIPTPPMTIAQLDAERLVLVVGPSKAVFARGDGKIRDMFGPAIQELLDSLP